MSYLESLTNKDFAKAKKLWSNVTEVMRWHLEAVTPIKIFESRRPIEGKSDYALKYRADNHYPTTYAPFTKAITAVTEVSRSANIRITNLLEDTKSHSMVHYLDEQIELVEFCKDTLTKIVEIESNSYLIAFQNPIIEHESSSLVDGELISHELELRYQWISSQDIIEVTNELFIANIGVWEYEEGKYSDLKIIINKNQTAFSVPTLISKKVVYIDIPIYENGLSQLPFIKVNQNIAYQDVIDGEKKHKIKVSLPFFWGAAAWGNKYYGEDTDFGIKLTRFTYPHTVKAILKCQMPGTTYKDGKHVDAMTNNICHRCKGTGNYIPEESPLGATYIDFEQFSNETGDPFPIIQFIEPGQAGIETSEKIMSTYYDNLLGELGLMKQNMTAQSGERASYDEASRISTYSAMVYNNFRVLESALNIKQDYLYNYRQREIPYIKVEVIGELNLKTTAEEIAELSVIKTNGSPPSIQIASIKRILLKQLGDNQHNRTIIDIASDYDDLFRYSDSEIVTAKAQLGTSFVSPRKVIVHNTIIDVLTKILRDNNLDESQVVAKLDDYYSKYDTVTNILV